MNYKILFPIIFLAIATSFTNCSEKCEAKDATCSETPPTNEVCAAYFENWFYNEQLNECEQIGYSGCSSKGFTTKEACDACVCN